MTLLRLRRYVLSSSWLSHWWLIYSIARIVFSSMNLVEIFTILIIVCSVSFHSLQPGSQWTKDTKGRSRVWSKLNTPTKHKAKYEANSILLLGGCSWLPALPGDNDKLNSDSAKSCQLAYISDAGSQGQGGSKSLFLSRNFSAVKLGACCWRQGLVQTLSLSLSLSLVTLVWHQSEIWSRAWRGAVIGFWLI